MKRIVLFSTPSPTNIDTLLALIFPKEISNKMFAYMPSDGENMLREVVPNLSWSIIRFQMLKEK
jgi:hypothetical protein